MQPRSYRDPYYTDLAFQTEQQLGLPRALLASVITHGERSNSDQVSEAGARTVAQVIPETRNALIKKYGVDPYAGDEQALLGAGYLLQESLKRNNNDPLIAAAEYHGGTSRSNWGPKTRAYVDRVQQGMREYNPIDRATPEEKAMMNGTAQSQDEDQILHYMYKNGQLTPEEQKDYETYFSGMPAGAGSAMPQNQQQSQPQTGQVTQSQESDDQILHQMYKSNQLTPEERKDYETYFNVGDAKNLNDYQKVITGKATPEETAQFKQKIASGEVKLPANYGIGEPVKQPGYQTAMPDKFSAAGEIPENKLWNRAANALSSVGSSIAENITGNERTTPEVAQAPNVFGNTGIPSTREGGGLPELSQLTDDGLQWKTDNLSQAVLSTTDDPQEMAQIIKANYPNVGVRQDAKGNWFFKSGINGKEYVYKPGVTGADFNLFAEKNFPTIETLPAYAGYAGKGLAQLGAKGLLALETALVGTDAYTTQANQEKQGGTFNTGEVVASIAAPGAATAIGYGANKITNKLAPNKLSQKIEEVFNPKPPTPNSPTSPPGAAVDAAAAGEAKAATAAADAASAVDNAAAGEADSLSPEFIDRMYKATKAAAKNPEDQQALQKLIEVSGGIDSDLLKGIRAVDPNAPAWLALKNQQARELLGQAFSKAGEKAPLTEAVQQFQNRLEKTASELGVDDITKVSGNISKSLLSEIENNDKVGEAILKKTAGNINARQPVDASKVMDYLSSLKEDLGSQFPAGYEALLQTLKNGSSTGQSGFLKWAELEELRKKTGKGYSEFGDFGGVDKARLDDLYARIKDVQSSHVSQELGNDAAVQYAKGFQYKQKSNELKNQFKQFFGEPVNGEYTGNITSKLTTALKNAGTNGDTKLLTELSNVIPPEHKTDAILSAVYQASSIGGKFEPAKYVKWFDSLRGNSTAYAQLLKAAGAKKSNSLVNKQLTTLYQASKAYNNFSKEVTTTGKSLADAFEGAAKNDFFNKLFSSKITKGLGGAVGTYIGGLTGAPAVLWLLEKQAAKHGSTGVKELKNLLTSDAMQNALEEFNKTGKLAEKTLLSVTNAKPAKILKSLVKDAEGKAQAEALKKQTRVDKIKGLAADPAAEQTVSVNVINAPVKKESTGKVNLFKNGVKNDKNK